MHSLGTSKIVLGGSAMGSKDMNRISSSPSLFVDTKAMGILGFTVSTSNVNPNP